MFVAAICYFSATKINFSDSAPAESKPPSPVEEPIFPIGESPLVQIEFPVQLQLDQTHQVGKSLGEDSLLAGFRVSIL